MNRARALTFNLTRDMETGQATASFSFLCPNCKQVHGCREIYSSVPAPFSEVGYVPPCGGGEVRVVMPWAERGGQ